MNKRLMKAAVGMAILVCSGRRLASVIIPRRNELTG